ncbi:MAG TPA: UDP-N-acetylmuramate dehydrogenase [Terriglobia bacterium]|nr:UDP-N-acetylmuramate dehydrogenase [Terriglobia bacterium]
MITFQAGSKLDVHEHTPLKPHTTFKIGGPARFFVEAADARQAREAIAFARRKSAAVFILGGGSNILVSDRGFDGLVLHPTRRGVAKTAEDGASVTLRIDSGEPWDDAVAETVERGWWGVENLSHIPGQSGAALVQNIGAYGQQLSDVLQSADVLELSSGELRSLDAAACGLEYRKTIFNSIRKGEFLILAINLKLSKRPQPNLGYRDVQAYFEERATREPCQADIRQAVIAIRDRKFPYPREERGGNAGSFFKNPTLNSYEFEALELRVAARFGAAALARLAAVRERMRGTGAIKLPAALLIDLCQLKGLTMGGAQVNPTQPLVILNLGGATSDDVLSLAGQLRRTVHRETGVSLSLEPELVGFTAEEKSRYLALE